MQPLVARKFVDDCLRDPPPVHEGQDFLDSLFGSARPEKLTRSIEPPGGVWSTERACYEFIATKVGPDSRCLETGMGVSTVVFTRLGTTHVCVTASALEVERMKRFLDDRAIDRSRLTFHLGFSDAVLPALEIDPVDLYLIDGGHGFPIPALDWYYGARHLRKGGTLIVDDTQLPQVQSLDAFLRRDSRWTELARHQKWVAYRRESEGSLSEEWIFQPEYSRPVTPAEHIRAAATAAADGLRGRGRRYKRQLKRWVRQKLA